jgi:hypothetical protein
MKTVRIGTGGFPITIGHLTTELGRGHRLAIKGDPAIRWQALRDLKGAAERTVQCEQRRVGQEGWGSRLLARQDSDGRWAGSIYTPKWTSTT